MKKTNHLKDLTQLFGLITAVANAAVAIFDLLSKVVNYADPVRKLSVFEEKHEGKALLRSY